MVNENTNDVEPEDEFISQHVVGSSQDKLNFWNDRAKLGQISGTNDFPLQHLEEQAVLQRITPQQKVLDVGCGDGTLLARIQEITKNKVWGLDFSGAMISLCKNKYDSANFAFFQGNMLQIEDFIHEEFDVIITKRSLINLNTFEDQTRAFVSIYSLLKPGGAMYCLENTLDGLDRLNAFRETVGLIKIEAPWHNRYFSEAEIDVLVNLVGATQEQTVEFASTYYLISRVVYAKLAQDRGEQLEYDSELNRISLELPSIGNLGATRMYVFRKPL